MNTRADLLAHVEKDAALAALLDEMRRRADSDPAHDVEHSLRVALWTLRLAPSSVRPRDAVAAALLHDLVNVPKDSPERAFASERSAELASELLARHGFRDDSVRLVSEAIEDHSFSAGKVPRSALGRALQDADRLEALGALGILRTASTGARMGARYFSSDDPWALERELDDRSYTLDHFFTKLLGLADTLKTPKGRLEARRRSAILWQFVVQLGAEIGHNVDEAQLRERVAGSERKAAR